MSQPRRQPANRTSTGTKRDPGIRRGPWTLIGLAITVVFLGAVFLFSQPDPSGRCVEQTRQGLVAGAKPKWALFQKPPAKLTIALDDVLKKPRRGHTFVRVRATRRNKTQPQLPAGRVGGFILGGVSSGSRELPFPVKVTARRSRDGTSVGLNACALRPGPREDTAPGRYSGRVRVAGRSVVATELPLEITVKRDRRLAITIAVLAAIISAVVAGANSRPSEVPAEKVNQHQKTHEVLWFLPLAGSVIAGTIAGYVVYHEDPTWGAALGGDWTKMVAAAVGGAAGGLTALAFPSRGARKRIAS
jgi:hypothetical protein